MKDSEDQDFTENMEQIKGYGYVCRAVVHVWLKGIRSHLIKRLKSKTLISHPSTAPTKALQAITTKTT